MLIALLSPVLILLLFVILVIYSFFKRDFKGPPNVYYASDVAEYMKNNAIKPSIENENVHILLHIHTVIYCHGLVDNLPILMEGYL